MTDASSSPSPDPLLDLTGKVVVMDTQGPLIYIGTLSHATDAYYVLAEADVHDSNDSRASKELYIVETRDLGVRVNRRRVLVLRNQVASISLITDVVS
jgi:hypothetical protein